MMIITQRDRRMTRQTNMHAWDSNPLLFEQLTAMRTLDRRTTESGILN